MNDEELKEYAISTMRLMGLLQQGIEMNMREILSLHKKIEDLEERLRGLEYGRTK